MARPEGITSSPSFIQSFESVEDTLPFTLTIAEQSTPVCGDRAPSVDMVVEITPQAISTAEPEMGDEIREEFVELEVKAELKWAKS